MVEKLEQEVESGAVPMDGVAVRDRLIEILAEVASTGRAPIDLSAEPAVLMMVGVNGTGKTTTIGKIAWHLSKEMGLSVIMAAADTYRAAAAEQLETWAERAGAELVRGEAGSDPGAVAYDAINAARARGADVVIVDTAGRLHTQSNLMEELAKVRRVIQKQIPDAPHETLISIDATTGQNGLRQAKVFSEAVEVDGVVLTKLDGTARGGIALAIASDLGIPVKLIGVGETLEDLRPFDPADYAKALLGGVDAVRCRPGEGLWDRRSRGRYLLGCLSMRSPSENNSANSTSSAEATRRRVPQRVSAPPSILVNSRSLTPDFAARALRDRPLALRRFLIAMPKAS